MNAITTSSMPAVAIEQPAVKVTAVEQKTSKTKQKYLNPKTGKMVGYVRAKNLGLV